MVKINVEKNIEIYETGDVLLLKNKVEQPLNNYIFAMITECSIENNKYYDLIMIRNDTVKGICQASKIDTYPTIDKLIKDIECFYTITKLEQDQFDININVKL